jgi:hypothetical protein
VAVVAVVMMRRVVAVSVADPNQGRLLMQALLAFGFGTVGKNVYRRKENRSRMAQECEPGDASDGLWHGGRSPGGAHG